MGLENEDFSDEDQRQYMNTWEHFSKNDLQII